ncbi:hypothetical protein ACFO3U_12290 [Flavobacterium ponti]|uniref:Sugar-binding protein n=1 Tax=Flavobacterium ponti TaxID=665133 RepID=A0ABV9P5X0_9FLAO
MKKLFVLFCLTSILISCKKEKTTENNDDTGTSRAHSEWNDFGLKGNVKSTLEYTTEEKKDGGNTSSVRKFENQFSPDIALKFDNKGKLINKISYKENGNVAEDIVYDGKDKMISKRNFTTATEYVETKYTWEGDKNTIIARRFNGSRLLDKEVFQYNNGRLVEHYKYDGNEKQANRTSFSYDDNNRVSEESYFRNKPTMQTRLSIEYDDNGNKTSEIYYDKNFKVISKTNSVYNSYNQMLTSQTFTDNGSLDVELSRTYDDKKRLITKESFEVYDNSKNKEEFEYDQNDNTTVWKVYKNGKLVSETVYKYDFKNNLIYQIVTDGKGNEIYNKQIEYTYDDNNNWIGKKTTVNNIVFYTSRKIEYY